ncbi:NADP-dependent oxidoreductase [Flavihumibacter fluvii]|uniref:NADP-dependent oxidoreductase n=1 Tax=Flavihumibacter fluvii TaxID=2838157 RepID=UPI001BDE17D9|nr:NADP-dependent oxidoreductase [Flavihumibacter fluvii]ULQ53142.1 NADP-dependent oxidoreductase [Flavihumibacter fluvii]
MVSTQIVLANRPKGMPVLTDFRFEDIELPVLSDGEVLVEGVYYSVDPYMRGRMNAAKSYAPPFEVDKPIIGGVVAKVLESKSLDFVAGDLVTGRLNWRKKDVVQEKLLKKIDASIAPPSYYLGILGMPGMTAYVGFIHIGKPKAGETVVVSGAAGAVGVIVGQLAKIKGCRVIGIAGSEEKIRLLKEEFGFDEAINYKTCPDLKKAIADLCPNGVDIYFDNVGGEISDAVINNINFHARIPLCGQIALYNSSVPPMGPRLQPMLLSRSVLMQGFIIFNYESLFPEAIKEMSQWIKAGKLKFTETVIQGFEHLPIALLGLFSGENTGKMLVKA